MKSSFFIARRFRLALAILCALLFHEGLANAQDRPERLDAGLGLRFMPGGWFTMGERDLRAYPALGFSPFVDVRLHRLFSIGLGGDFTFNVIPNLSRYAVGSMYGGSLRLKMEYPNSTRVTPYALLCAGYLVIRLSNGAPGVGTSADGVTLAAHAGARLRVGGRHSLFGEIGYMWGNQKLDGQSYAPSYVVVALGWQVSF